MAEVYDILLDNSLDLSIKNGDLEVGESTLQHQHLLLITEKGQFKQHPTAGVGARSFLLDDRDKDDLQQEIQKEFEDDGMNVAKLVLNDYDNIEAEAGYGS